MYNICLIKYIEYALLQERAIGWLDIGPTSTRCMRRDAGGMNANCEWCDIVTSGLALVHRIYLIVFHYFSKLSVTFYHVFTGSPHDYVHRIIGFRKNP